MQTARLTAGLTSAMAPGPKAEAEAGENQLKHRCPEELDTKDVPRLPSWVLALIKRRSSPRRFPREFPIIGGGTMQRLQTGFWIYSSFIALMEVLLVGSIHASEQIDVGYRDFSCPKSPGRLTGEKPESKLWFNDGVWWGILCRGDGTTGTY